VAASAATDGDWSRRAEARLAPRRRDLDPDSTPMLTPTAQPVTHAPELLAPAGDWDALKAAVANGADAVYFGLDQFNARYRATNFTLEELPEVMAYLRRHNVRGFLTFNTLIFSDELPAAADYIKHVAAAGIWAWSA
jgi:hypothetical protein